MQDIDHRERQQAAARLQVHLLQKGRPAAYKVRLIDGFADPDRKDAPAALRPLAGNGPLAILQRLVLAVERAIRRNAADEHVSHEQANNPVTSHL